MTGVVYHGGCVEVLKTLADNSVDAVVCDPPYGLSDHKPEEVAACLSAWIAGEEYMPKGKGFMGKAWDGWVPGPATWRECLRVLKPGGHLLAFAGTRSMDLMCMAIRLSGFELRDSIGHAHDGGQAPLLAWCYASGFPKSLNVAKAIESGGGRPEDIRRMQQGDDYRPSGRGRINYDHGAASAMDSGPAQWEPATDAARQWQGWGTALKPAWEPIILARKPLTGTVAENVQRWGCGALNIDGCRVGSDGGCAGAGAGAGARVYGDGLNGTFAKAVPGMGRWPANLIHDGSDEVVGLFPVTGAARSGHRGKGKGDTGCFGVYGGDSTVRGHDDNGGSAARFFYCAKASKRDRNSGLDSFKDVIIEWTQSLSDEANSWASEDRKARLRVDTDQFQLKVIGVYGTPINDATEWNTMLFGSQPTEQYQKGLTYITKTATSSTTTLEILNCFQSLITSESTRVANCETALCGSRAEIAADGTLSIVITSERMASALGADRALSPMLCRISVKDVRSEHPTIKPTDLMRYLVRLVTPPGGTVLDPFAGSGSTGKACALEGFGFIGIEREAEYVEIARARIRHAYDQRIAERQTTQQHDIFGADDGSG